MNNTSHATVLSRWRGIRCGLIGGLSLLSFTADAKDRLISAEDALIRFRDACDNEIKQSASPETMDRIGRMRDTQDLVIARKEIKRFFFFKEPKLLTEFSRYAFFGSYEAVAKSNGDVWVLHYGVGSTVFIAADSGAVLCIAEIPRG